MPSLQKFHGKYVWSFCNSSTGKAAKFTYQRGAIKNPPICTDISSGKPIGSPDQPTSVCYTYIKVFINYLFSVDIFSFKIWATDEDLNVRKAVWAKIIFWKPFFHLPRTEHDGSSLLHLCQTSQLAIPGISSLKAKTHEPLLSQIRTPTPIGREEWKSAASAFMNIVPVCAGIHPKTEVESSHLETFTGLEQYCTMISTYTKMNRKSTYE